MSEITEDVLEFPDPTPFPTVEPDIFEYVFTTGILMLVTMLRETEIHSEGWHTGLPVDGGPEDGRAAVFYLEKDGTSYGDSSWDDNRVDQSPQDDPPVGWLGVPEFNWQKFCKVRITLNRASDDGTISNQVNTPDSPYVVDADELTTLLTEIGAI